MRFLFIAIFSATLPYEGGANAETVQDYLKAFHNDPAKMMQRLPSEVDANGIARPRGYIDDKVVAERIRARTEIREKIMARSKQLLTAPPPPPGPKEKDTADLLIDPGTPIVRSLYEIQSRGFMRISAPIIPWADSYWPKYSGEISQRYADRGFPNSKSWDVNYGYFLSYPPSAIVNSGNSTLINVLSPAEKYDFVMGDMNFTLTKYAWNEGKKGKKEEGGIGSWEGICHGWAGAAHMLQPFNERPIVVQSQNGVPVTFYPQDMKALQTMLWANGSPTSRFVGNRCNVEKPKKNAYGRIIDKGCLDPNPATWHIALINQFGINKRNFVMDATYDFQVWNHPLASIRYRYFNPATREESDSLSKAMIPISKYRADYFREFRSDSAKYVVGIAMDVTYVIEIVPGQERVFDTPTKTLRLIYDLELDENTNIIGGEWYSNAHPDFLWTYEGDAQAMAYAESELLNDPWNNSTPVPLQWTPVARKASSYGIPLFSFIKKSLDAEGYTSYTGPRTIDY